MILQVASLRYNVIFKKAFSDVEIFKGFVRDLLGIHLDIDKVETEKAFSPTIGNVETRFDLYAEDKKNRVIVEIQHRNFPDHYHRFLHYHCAALLEQVADSDSYKSTVTVFTIVILTFGDRHKTDVAIIDFDPKKRSGEKLNEVPHQLIYLFPKYVNDDTPESYRDWLLAIQDSLDEAVIVENYPQPEIQKVFQMIKKDLVSPQERARMQDEYGNEQLEQKKYEEGLAEGETRGELKRAREIARALLQQGTLDLPTIATLNGLDKDALERLTNR